MGVVGYFERDFQQQIRQDALQAMLENWQALGLMQRVNSLAEFLAMQVEVLALSDYGQALKNLQSLAEHCRKSYGDMVQFVFPQMVVHWGLNQSDWREVSLQALVELTELYTSEFAVRQFIAAYPDEAMQATLVKWCASESPHHRRLASESSRPRLPWAKDLALTKHQPEWSLPILERLKQDTHRYVQKSVANHLHDHLKFQPEWAYAVLEKWVETQSVSPWIVRHALRNEKDKTPQAKRILEKCTS